MKQVLVEDERGKTWAVYDEDSAWPHCSALLKTGVAEVVLPRSLLLSGKLPDSFEYRTYADVSKDAVAQYPEVAAEVCRQIRLQDCLEFLRRQEEKNTDGYIREE